jgi:NADH-quinone oxidoreductase subunit A
MLIFRSDYLGLFIFFLVSLFFSLFLFIISYFVSLKNVDFEKWTSYECGFEPYDDSRQVLDIHFFIIAILFVIFDLEVVLMLPWAISISILGTFGFWVMLVFLLFLIIGFFYEWSYGALDWPLV